MKILNASNFTSVAEFSQALLGVANDDEPAVLIVDGQILAVSPAEIAKEHIASRIAARFAENPSLLHDLQSRLENESSEAWE